MDIMLCLPLGRIYPWIMCLNTFFFPLFWLNLIDTFPFPLVCLNPFYDLYDISSNNSLLVQTHRCTTLSVRPCYYCWWHSGNHRRTRTLPIGPPRFNEQENGSVCPSPLVPTLLLTYNWQATLWHALLSWSCKMSPPFLLLTHMVGP